MTCFRRFRHYFNLLDTLGPTDLFRSADVNSVCSTMKRVLSCVDLRSEANTEGTDVAGPSVINSNNQPKPKKSKRGRGITAEQSNAIEDTFDRVMSQIANSPMSPSASVVETDTHTVHSDELKFQLKQQQVVIKSLEQKIDLLVDQLQRVCDFLGLSTVSIQSDTPPPVHRTEECSLITDVLPTEAELADSDNLVVMNSHLQKPKANRQQRQSHENNQTIKDIVLDAVFNENNDRAKRAKSVVISGVQDSADFHDNDLVRQLIRSEFNFDFAPSELHCRRLGEKIPEHIQPLLVALPSAEDAAWLVASAKQLRNSQSDWIRDNVFINRNLSRAERRLAYEQRCKRRAKNNKNNENNETVSDRGQAIRVVVNSRRVPSRRSSSSSFVRLPDIDNHPDQFLQAFPALSRETGGSTARSCTATAAPAANTTGLQRSDVPVIDSSNPAAARTTSPCSLSAPSSISIEATGATTTTA